MSREDLLADLQGEVVARPMPVPPPPRTTPAFDLTVTPLRWSLPALGPAPSGVGVSAQVGPVRLTVGMR